MQETKDLDSMISQFSAAGPVAMIHCKYSSHADILFKRIKNDFDNKAYNIIRGSGLMKKESDLYLRIVCRAMIKAEVPNEQIVKHWATYPNVFEWSLSVKDHVVCTAAFNAVGTGIQIMIWSSGLKDQQANKTIEAAQRECD